MADTRPLRPGIVVILTFAAAIAIGTVLLLFPWATPGEERAQPLEAVFTATSAITVTGLSTVDTATAWTTGGQAVILLLVALGGFGITATGTLLVVVIGRRVGMRSQLLAQAETPGLTLGEVRRMLRFVALASLLAEATGAVILTLRWWIAYHQPLGEAAWNGLFQSVSAYNNAGFSTFSDNLVSYNSDPVILGVIMILIVLGGLGAPVLYAMRGRGWRQPRKWTLHVRLTLWATAALIVVGAVLITWFEWTNPATLGSASAGDSVLNGLFGSVTARTAGFNSFSYGGATEETLLVTTILMFIGGGSASTAGGIKITTFIVLVLMVVAEARGDRDVNAGNRRISQRTQRTAVSIAAAYILLSTLGVMWLSAVTTFPLRDVLLETVSAIATVGLSTGITAQMPPHGQIALIALMFIGRLGAMTLATALALRDRTLTYRLPEGRPIVG